MRLFVPTWEYWEHRLREEQDEEAGCEPLTEEEREEDNIFFPVDGLTFRERLELIFAGEYEKARMPTPLLNWWDREYAMQQQRDRAPIDLLWCSAFDAVVALKLNAVAVKNRTCGREVLDGETIGYRPSADHRLECLLVGHGLVHNGCRHHNRMSNETDAWLATGQWFAPTRLIYGMTEEELRARLPTLPEWFVELHLARARLEYAERRYVWAPSGA